MRNTIITLLLCLFALQINAQQNLVSNPSFESGESQWKFGVWGDPKPQASFKIDKNKSKKGNSSGIVRVKSKESAPFKVNLQQRIEIKKRKKYQLSFWIKNMKRKESTIDILIRLNNSKNAKGKLADIVRKQFKFNTKGLWHKITYDFDTKKVSKGFDYKTADFHIGFASQMGTCWVDDIQIIEK